MIRNSALFFLLLLPLFSFAQKTDAEKEMFRFKNGKSLEKAVLDPVDAYYVTENNYTDSVFPNAAISKLYNVEHLVVMGRFCRKSPNDPYLPPLKIRIDTVALKKLLNLKYLEFSYFDFHEFPVELCCLPQLRGLSLDISFVDTIPEQIARLRNLQLLEMRLNNISSLPASIATMENLQEIDLANNHFTEFPAVVLQMKNLHKLILANVESNSEFILDYHWPFRVYINQINYEAEHETVLAALKMDSMNMLFIQVNSKAEKDRLLAVLQAGNLEKKITWRVAPMVKM